MKMKTIFFLLTLIFCSSGLYSQTGQDYFEKLRLKRQDWKIKTVTDGSCTDFYDEQGYHIKREVNDNFNNKTYIYNITNLPDGNITVEVDLGPEGINKQTGSPALFYHTWFDPYNLIDNVVLKIDELNRINEEIFTGFDYPGSDNTKYYYEILKFYPSRSEFYSDSKLISTTKYFYDGKGILLKEETTEVSTGKSYITEYTYEYYEN